MNGEPTSLAALCLLGLILGARHGFDADHLAVIDGITRLNAERRPRLAQFAGALFSLGHGAVILMVIVGADLVAAQVEIPAWLSFSGTLVSIIFLLALAVLNLLAVARTPAHQVVRPTGARAHWLAKARILTTTTGVLATGFLFAISFDFVSQAVLFAVIGHHLGGSGDALLAGLCFVIGMLAIDGINGLWIARLVQATNRRAAIASRVMTTSVGLISLAVCCLAFSEAIVPAVDRWGDAHAFWFGVTICATLGLAGLLAFALAGAHPHAPVVEQR